VLKHSHTHQPTIKETSSIVSSCRNSHYGVSYSSNDHFYIEWMKTFAGDRVSHENVHTLFDNSFHQG